MQPSKESFKERVKSIYFFLLSFGLHLSLVLILALFSFFKPAVDKPVEIVLLETSTDVQPINEVLAEADLIKKIAPDHRNQIVETDENFANNKQNDKAKFLSAKNNAVEKETKAKTGEQFKNALKQGAQTVANEKKSASEKSETSNEKTLPNLFAKEFDPYSSLKQKQELLDSAKNKANETIADSGVEKGEQSTTNDHLENVGDDLVTRLNTKEFKYYSYYQRIKGQLNQWWGPKVRERMVRMFKRGRMLASEGNKTTKLVIVLNDVGTLVRVQVLGESGVRDLDEAAIDAFRAAAPFPNPPKGIVDADGTVKIRWDFVIEL